MAAVYLQGQQYHEHGAAQGLAHPQVLIAVIHMFLVEMRSCELQGYKASSLAKIVVLLMSQPTMPHAANSMQSCTIDRWVARLTATRDPRQLQTKCQQNK
eukprot:2098528-Amphidinium_carterae.1